MPLRPSTATHAGICTGCWRAIGLGGFDAVDPRSRRPPIQSAPRPLEAVQERIIELRLALIKDGLDAGPVTIAWHLASTKATERRRPQRSGASCTPPGLITPEPRKRPRSSYLRFAAAQPNECWQSDFTHWRLADGTDIEILNWLDDHSRLLLSCHRPAPASPAMTSSPPSATNINELRPTRHQPSPTTAPSTPPDSPAAKTPSNTCSPSSASPRRTGTPATPRPRARSSDSTRPSRRWLANQPPARDPRTTSKPARPFRDLYNNERPHRELDRATPASRLHRAAESNRTRPR